MNSSFIFNYTHTNTRRKWTNISQNVRCDWHVDEVYVLKLENHMIFTSATIDWIEYRRDLITFSLNKLTHNDDDAFARRANQNKPCFFFFSIINQMDQHSFSISLLIRIKHDRKWVTEFTVFYLMLNGKIFTELEATTNFTFSNFLSEISVALLSCITNKHINEYNIRKQNVFFCEWVNECVCVWFSMVLVWFQ